jgi:hypothetical protein
MLSGGGQRRIRFYNHLAAPATKMPELQNSTLRERKIPSEQLQVLVRGGNLYAVVDACNVPMVPKKVLEVGDQRAVSLYRGTAEEELWEVAPYLMKVDQLAMEWLKLNAKKEGWGIFIAAKADLEVLRTHLRHFLKVQSPRGEVWRFRFYDPRVIEFFLPICSAAELKAFFGPIMAYGVSEPGLKEAKFWQEATDWNSMQMSPPRVEMRPYFRIRPEQEKEFEKYADLVFLRETVLYVKEQHAEKVAGLSETIIQQRVKTAIDRAKSFGLRLEDSILFFLALMFDIAPNFYEQPGIHKALTTGERSPDLRMDELLDNTTDDDWDQAEESYDEGKWQDGD